VAVCPSGSLTHRDIPVEKCPPVEKSLKVTADRLEHLMRSRRSIRNYRDKPVPRDVISRLLDVARYAPTGHNVQDVEWIVVDKKEDMSRLEKIGLEWIRWAVKNQPQRPGMDMGRMLERAEKTGTLFLRGAPALIVNHGPKGSPMSLINCTIAMTYLELMAYSLGLGCCWAGFIYFMANGYPPMRQALGIPEGRAAGGCMMLGYPKYKFQRIPVRKEARVGWRG
jgi:nitroreductase